MAVLAELDVQITAGLKAGRIVRLPNGLRFEPIGKRDGSINIVIKASSEMIKTVNSLFREKWINAEHIGKTEAEMIEHWNHKHPKDQIS